ncbi:MAG: Asp-tRNA(Asn)/Glu-tRNA(Gln) amidotransferase GatCAB subunit C [Gemmataceae bacterium]
MALTEDQVRWVAHLARLEFAPEEIELFTAQLSQIVDYVNQLQKLDTEKVEPLAHCLPISNVFRPDEVQPSLTVDEALANAPDRRGAYYGVPAVLD